MSQPWENEPDSVDFWDEATGYPIAIRRVKSMGHLCGYIGVPEHHPWNGRNYNQNVPAPKDAMEREVSVDEMGVINLVCGAHLADPESNSYPIDLLVRCHGGLTYSNNAKNFRDDRAPWWFGFDCAHAGDFQPGMQELRGGLGLPRDDEEYRDIEYVKSAARKAAADLALAEKTTEPTE